MRYGKRLTLSAIAVLVLVLPGTSAFAVHNDLFAGAEVIGVPATITHSTAGAALNEAGEPTGNQPANCGPINRTIWYRITAPTTGFYIADTVGSTFDTMLAVFTGSAVNALTLVSCADDFPTGPPGQGLRSQVGWSATVGTTYLIQLGGYFGSSGSSTLHVCELGAPTGLTAQPTASNTIGAIDLAWSALATAPCAIAGYELERNGGSGPTTSPTSTSTTDGGLTPLTNYTYRVRGRALAVQQFSPAVTTYNGGPYSASACNKPFPWVGAVGCV